MQNSAVPHAGSSRRPHGWRPSHRVRRVVQLVLPVLAVGVALVAVPAAHAEGPGYGGSADKLTVTWSRTTAATTPTETSTSAPTSTAPSATSSATSSAAAPTAASTAAEAPSAAAPTAATPTAIPTTGASSTSAVPVLTTASGGRGAAAAVPRSVPAATGTVTTGSGLQVGGIGFRGLSVVSVRVGSRPPFLARVDSTGTLSVAAPAAAADAVTAGTSVVALGRAPSGTSKTLVGSVPPRPSGTGPVDLVPWIATAVLLGLVGSWLVRRLGSAASRVRES